MKEYILNLMEEERSILEEIIRIDNRVQFSNTTFDELYTKINNLNIDFQKLENKCIAITDGIYDSVLRVLFNYAYSIDCLNVDCRNVGFYLWLIDRINKYDNNISIILDTDNNYNEYKKYDLFIISGVDSFVDFASDLYKEKDLIRFVN